MILVTGGAGYVGTELVASLLRLGESVRVVDIQWFGNTLAPHPRLDVIQADVRDVEACWLDDVDRICHLAGLSNDPTADFMPVLNISANVFASRRLADVAAEKATNEGRPIRCLLASSCSVYYSSVAADGHVHQITEDTPVSPTSNYGKSKRLAELELIRASERSPNFCPVILRKGTLFGASARMRFDLVVNAFTLQAWKQRSLTVHGSGEAWRPLLHVQDAVDAYVYLLSAPAEAVRGRIFNVLHKNYRILELAHWVSEILERHRGIDVRVRRDRSIDDGGRSYYVNGSRIAAQIGFRAERGTMRAVLETWDALELGAYGKEPEQDANFFNIRRIRDLMPMPVADDSGRGSQRHT
jgi:nucleoside-diphosphate-sugar epimerase